MASLGLDYSDDEEDQPSSSSSTTTTAGSRKEVGTGDGAQNDWGGETEDYKEAHQKALPFDFSALRQRFSVQLAPDVGKADLISDTESPFARQLTYNPKYSALWAPVAGPEQPFLAGTLNALPNNCPTGFIEGHNMDDLSFYGQLHHHDQLNAGGNGKKKAGKKRVAREKSDPASDDYLGPWAPRAEDKLPELTEEQKAEIEARDKEVAEQAAKRAKRERQAFESTTIFHGKELRDYLGRSYVDPPTDLKPGVNEAYLPKRRLHTYTGHTKGVSTIRFFPNYGHILVSAGLDSTIKIWDVYNERGCLRTIMGHQKAVRDICFSNDGRKFLSTSYDRKTKLWDTETGQELGNFSNGKIPYCVKFNPDEDKQNEFLVGGSDKKIIQWDIRENKIVQEYDQHLGAVNTITFVDENRRFVTSSDDKSLRVWEYGIPVVIKYISEPHMHSMPAITLHPNQKWFLAQSLDNQILVYSTRDRFKLNKKKRFAGHLIAGFACEIGLSPDGRYVVSGDSDGKMWFWDWKTSRILKTLKAHQGVTISCQWHPIETSRLATCGWDGSIHLWD